MSGEHVASCPFCPYSAGSKGSVKAHITASTDGDHEGVSGPQVADQIEIEEESSAGSTAEQQTTADQSSAQAVQFPDNPDAGSTAEQGTDSSGDQCCNDPDLQGSAGDLVVGPSHPSDRLAQQHDGRVFLVSDQKSMLQLEDGDRLCMTCDTVQEAP